MSPILTPTTIFPCSLTGRTGGSEPQKSGSNPDRGARMRRFIVLNNKPFGNNTYICDGSGCRQCAIRFKCFTNALSDIVEVDWLLIKTSKSPMKLLQGVTGSKIYVKGSKKYLALAKTMERQPNEPRQSYRAW